MLPAYNEVVSGTSFIQTLKDGVWAGSPLPALRVSSRDFSHLRKEKRFSGLIGSVVRILRSDSS